MLLFVGGLRLYRGEVQILIIEAEVGKRGDRDHLEVVDGAVGIQSESDEGIFDGMVAPVCLEGVVLPVLEIGDAFGGVLEIEDQATVFLLDIHLAIPGIRIVTGVFFERERRLGIGGAGL